MTVRSHRADNVVDEVGVWLTGEFGARLPVTEIDRVIHVTRIDLESCIAPEELGEMLHRLGRARLQRLLLLAPPHEGADPANALTADLPDTSRGVSGNRTRRCGQAGR